MHLVVFYEDWCDKCNVLDPIFARLSIKYTDARRRCALPETNYS